MVRILLTIAKLLEDYLRENTPFSELRPSFILIGSVAEGTRLNQSTHEIDVTVDFEALKENPFRIVRFKKEDSEVTHDAMKVLVPEGLPFLTEFADKDCIFLFPKFLRNLLETIDSALKTLKTSEVWPFGLIAQVFLVRISTSVVVVKICSCYKSGLPLI